jgi:uncharacterized protein YkwD
MGGFFTMNSKRLFRGTPYMLAAALVACTCLYGCAAIDTLIHDIAVGSKSSSSSEASSRAKTEFYGTDFEIDPSAPGRTDFSPMLEQGVLELVNAERKSLSLAELAEDKELNATARERSKELLQNAHFDHTRPDGRDWSTIMDEHKYSYTVISENLQKGRSPDISAQEIFDSWKESKAHYAAMIANDVTRTGVGIYVRETEQGGYEWYATQHFSAPR